MDAPPLACWEWPEVKNTSSGIRLGRLGSLLPPPPCDDELFTMSLSAPVFLPVTEGKKKLFLCLLKELNETMRIDADGVPVILY